jgi:hypothetical protein
MQMPYWTMITYLIFYFFYEINGEEVFFEGAWRVEDDRTALMDVHCVRVS